MKTLLTAAALVAVTAASAYAQAKPPTAVPEIDAGAGMAVVAALGASVALLWERRRRK